MKFCDMCNNMLYVNIDNDKNMIYYCKNCNNKEVIDKDQGSICVIDDNKLTDELKYSQYINKYIKFDPTLPRVNNIICPNESCIKKSSDENEVIYIKYDFTDMKYIYKCAYCDHFWTKN